jgi:hypothetical protein
MPDKTAEELKKELDAANESLEKLRKTQEGVNAALGGGSTRAFNLNYNAVSNYYASIVPSLGSIQEAFEKTKASMSFEGALQFLDEEATVIQNAFGVSKERLGEFKQAIADTSVELVQFGMDQDDAAKLITTTSKVLGTTGVVGQEALRELGAASKITGQEFGTLAQSFRDVGVSIYDVGDKMKEVVNYARSVGVSVAAVSEGVVDNLGEMNKYNFENGIGGLTKMAAQAARLGISMDTVFGFAEKIFNPEGAIEMAAGLQRLGVASSELLDPLRAMDLAANDPEELQNQLVELTKTFTKFNEKTQQFEIMPGEKRRLREIAQEMGIPIDQLTKMSIKAAEFDTKLKKIEFPSFAADQETKELIAGMSQMKEGRAVIAVKDDRGVETLKDINMLTPEDIEKLKESEEESSKSLEQLAIEQLDQMKLLNSQIAAAAGKTVLGAASAGEVNRITSAGAALTRSLAVEFNKEVKTEGVRGGVSSVLNPVEVGLVEGLRQGDATKIAEGFTNAAAALINLEPKITTTITQVATNAFTTAANDVKKIYEDVGNKPKSESEKKVVDVNLNLNLNSNLDGQSNNLLVNGLIGQLKSNSAQANELNKVLNINYLEGNQ